jgi:hypothetical protein
MFRFTIRDLLALTVVVATLCAAFVNSRVLVRALAAQCDKAWDHFSAYDPPLTGRDSVPPEW